MSETIAKLEEEEINDLMHKIIRLTKINNALTIENMKLKEDLDNIEVEKNKLQLKLTPAGNKGDYPT